MMEADRRTPEYTIDLFADRANARDVARGILHLIFFHRTFSTITPSTLEVLDLTLPRVQDNDLSTLVDQRVNDLLRNLDLDSYQQQNTHYGGNTGGGGGGGGGAGIASGAGSGQGGRGQFGIQFMEKKRRKGWFGAADEEMVWERWVVSLTLASPKTETETYKVRRAMEKSLDNAFAKVMVVVGRDTAHIPPITTNEGNPFPYSILVKRRDEGWGRGIRVF